MIGIYAIRKLTDEEEQQIISLEYEMMVDEDLSESVGVLEWFLLPGQNLDELKCDNLIEYTSEISLREEATEEHEKKGILPPYRSSHFFHKRIIKSIDKVWINHRELEEELDKAKETLLPGEYIFIHEEE